MTPTTLIQKGLFTRKYHLFYRFVIPFALGTLLGLIQRPFDLWPMVFFVLPLAYYFVKKRTSFQSFLFGLFLGLGYFSLSMNWIIHPFFINADMFGKLAIPGFLGFQLMLASLWACLLYTSPSPRDA